MSMEEARERNDEAIDILDALLSREWFPSAANIQNSKTCARCRARCSSRRRQNGRQSSATTPHARPRAVARRSRPAFNPTVRIKEIFDAYRDEADKVGFKATPDHLGLRRRIAIAQSESEAKEYMEAMTERVRAVLAKDPRAASKHVPDSPDRDKVLKGKSFEVSDEEFLHGTPAQIAEIVIDQCRRTGAGHFLTILHWGAPIDEVMRGHELFSRDVIPLLRKANVA